jgi:hypothetical protein
VSLGDYLRTSNANSFELAALKRIAPSGEIHLAGRHLATVQPASQK